MQKNFEEYPKYLFHEGTNIEADKLFCPKKAVIDGKKGWIFRVWAPNARDVSLVGDFNGWEVGATPMKKTTAEYGKSLSKDLKFTTLINTPLLQKR